MAGKKILLQLVAASVIALAGAIGSLSQSSPGQPESTEQSMGYQVELCTDGDTCRVLDSEGKKFRIRLVGIDAPETSHGKKKPGQPFALESKDYLNQQIQNKSITVKSYGTDNYGRVLGEIYVGARNINVDIVSQGLAEVYRGRAPSGLDTNVYRQAEQNAQNKKVGIWSQAGYQSPKEYRKRRKN